MPETGGVTSGQNWPLEDTLCPGHATAGMVERYQHADRTSRSRLAENMSKLADL